MNTSKKLLAVTIALSSAFTGTQNASVPLNPTKEALPVVVLGGGIGGLTAALYSARAGHQTLVIEGEMPGGLLTQSHSVQNWPGILDAPGEAIAVDIKEQCIAQGVTFAASKVVGADFSQYPYTIKTVGVDDEDKTEEIKALGTIIAMGTTSNYLGIPGEQENWGEGVSNCAVCDGGLYQDKTVCVVGGGDAAIEEASYLSRIAKKVYVLVRKDKLRAVDTLKDVVVGKPNVEVLYNHEIASINDKGDGVTSVTLSNNRTRTSREISVDGVFLAIGSTPNGEVFKGKLDLDDKGYILVDGSQATSVPGVYAIGDIADPEFKQAVSAAGDGCKAALSLNKYLQNMEASQTAQAAEFVVETIQTEPVVMRSAASPNGGVKAISGADQFNAEINKGGVVVVDFFATWCGPCKRLEPIYKDLASEFAGRATFLKVDVDKNRALIQKYGIKSMPTLLYFKDGKQVAKYKDPDRTKKHLREKVNNLL